jgi:tRNA (adenine57-N1/adenine58-N1)-methyltransferase
MGLENYITVTHRDVLSCGFLLDDKVTDNSMDAVFLDLPSPHMAVKHAYQVLRTKGRLCNFSPCIEQVQRASLEMARQGFYEIVTIECLNREFDVRKTGFREIPDYEAKGEDKEDKKREKKAYDKEMLVAQPMTEIRGHTGYLTFAIKF